MTLPNFLGIGVMRAGTTWLHIQLRSHKQVYMAPEKELNFFTDFYDRGIEWYSEHFPSTKEAVQYRAIGEITPTYIADPDAPARIRAHLPESRLIVMLRNPVDRAYSEYTKTLRNFNFKGTFDDFVAQNKNVLARGYYTEQLERYFRLFSREQFLILIFEDTVSNHQGTIQKLAAFLQIDPAGFNLDQMQQKINASYLPRLPKLYSSAVTVRQYLAKRSFGWIFTTAEKVGVVDASRRVFRFRGPRSELPKLEGRVRKQLSDLYSQEIRNLQELLDEDLSTWQS